jgi:hypothetical protein
MHQSISANTEPAAWNDLKLSIGLVTRLMARASCSTMLLRYLTWGTRIGTLRPALTAFIAALLAPLLSIATLFGSQIVPMALSKKRLAAPISLRDQQEVDSLALLVDGAVEVFPDTLDFDVGLIHAPTAANRTLVFSAIFSMSGKKQMAHRSIAERSTDTPRSSMISSRCRQLSGCRPGSHPTESASL